MDKQPSNNSKIYRSILIVLCAALLIAGTVYAGNIYGRDRAEQLQTEPVLPSEENTIAETEQTDFTEPAATQSQIVNVDATIPQEQQEEEEIVNILLVGQDAGSGHTRADTIILCSFNKTNKTVAMISFLRDLYVKIPGYEDNRINAAHSFGGIELLKETLYENFGVEVDGTVQVDFNKFESIIDTMGGVPMDLTAAEAGYVNKHTGQYVLSEGTHVLNGKQALVFARNRHDIDGDFSRTNRQRKLLKQLIETYKDKHVLEMVSLLCDIIPLIKTDISKIDLTAYTFSLFPMLSSAEIRTLAIPVEDGYYNADIGGKFVLVPDVEKNIQAIHDALS